MCVFLKMGNFISYILDHVLLMLPRSKVPGYFYFFVFSRHQVAVREHCFEICVREWERGGEILKEWERGKGTLPKSLWFHILFHCSGTLMSLFHNHEQATALLLSVLHLCLEDKMLSYELDFIKCQIF